MVPLFPEKWIHVTPPVTHAHTQIYTHKNVSLDILYKGFFYSRWERRKKFQKTHKRNILVSLRSRPTSFTWAAQEHETDGAVVNFQSFQCSTCTDSSWLSSTLCMNHKRSYIANIFSENIRRRKRSPDSDEFRAPSESYFYPCFFVMTGLGQLWGKLSGVSQAALHSACQYMTPSWLGTSYKH